MSTTERDQRRRAPRRNASAPCVIRIELRDGMGNPRNITADLVDWSDTGLSIALVAPIKPGAIVKVRGKLGDERLEISRRATITWCNEDSNEHSNYNHPSVGSEFEPLDYYEIMQLSPNADTETIHRVYRLLAQRYHPDNAGTGNSELFVQLTDAFQTLSDPERRA